MRNRFTRSLFLLGVLFVLSFVSSAGAASTPMTNNRHVFINVANDAGVKYNMDCAAYSSTYPLCSDNTYFMKADGGGLNSNWMSEVPITVKATGAAHVNSVSTADNTYTGRIYLYDDGGRGFTDNTILLLSVKGPIADDFSVKIKSSGYTWTPATAGVYNPTFPTTHATGTVGTTSPYIGLPIQGVGLTYQPEVLNETFTKADFIYGPQVYRPGPGTLGTWSLPFYPSQTVSDPTSQEYLMFIDLKAGPLGVTATSSGVLDDGSSVQNNGAVVVDYTITNMHGVAAFNMYGWASAANQGEGISFTNPTTNGYTISYTGLPVAGVTYSPSGPYKSGTNVTITADFSRYLLDSPVPTITMGGGVSLTDTMTKVDPNHYSYTYTVGSGNSDVNVSFNGTDTASNPLTFTPSSGATFTIDNTPPTVASATPAAGATGVANDGAVTVVFSEAVDPSTVTPGTFSVNGVTGSVSYDSTTKTARFSPAATLANGTLYTVAINGVKDLAGNAIDPVTWTFTTSLVTATVTLSNLNQTYDGTAKTPTVTTVPSGLSVILTYNGNSAAPVNSGSYAVAATVNNSPYQGSATGTLTIAKASQSMGSITFGSSTLAAGATTTASATATSGLSPVFSSLYTDICTVSGSTVTGVAIGTCTIAANQPGDLNYNQAAQVTGTITISQGTQTIGAITISPDPLTAGHASTVSAIASSGLCVTLKSTTPSVCTISGTTVTGVKVGTCKITADQAGNASYSPAARVMASFPVGKGSQTIGALTFTPAAVTMGKTTKVSATATSGLKVTFTTATPSVCRVSGATVTGVKAGTCTIAAKQSGNTNYSAASQVTQDITIDKKSQTIGTLKFSPAYVSVGKTTKVSAKATSGLAASFSSLTSDICTVSGTTVTGVAAGTCVIAADQAGNATYDAAGQATGSITTDPALALTISALPDGAVATSTSLNISGSVTNPARFKTLKVNGTTVKPDTDGFFTYPLQLIAGSNGITITASNKLGENASDTRSITLNASSLKLTADSLPDDATSSGNYVTVTGTVTTASGEVDPTATVTWSVNGAPAQSAALTDSAYTFTAGLESGMNTILITAATTSGSESRIKRTVYSQQPFSLSVTDPAIDVRTVKKTYILAGKVSGNSTPVTVTVGFNGKTYTPAVTGDGSFTQQVTFGSAKLYQAVVTAVDQNGGSQTVRRNFLHTPASSYTSSAVNLAKRIALGSVKPTAAQIRKLDVAPMVNGVSVGDGVIDMEDVTIIQNIVQGLIK
jgi:hypothetical protein